MKSLERKYNGIRQRHIYWSSYTCFAEAATNAKYSRKIIMHWFNLLVDKDDYNPKEKKSIISHLLKLSGTPEEGINQSQIAPQKPSEVSETNLINPLTK